MHRAMPAPTVKPARIAAVMYFFSRANGAFQIFSPLREIGRDGRGKRAARAVGISGANPRRDQYAANFLPSKKKSTAGPLR